MNLSVVSVVNRRFILDAETGISARLFSPKWTKQILRPSCSDHRRNVIAIYDSDYLYRICDGRAHHGSCAGLLILYELGPISNTETDRRARGGTMAMDPHRGAGHDRPR